MVTESDLKTILKHDVLAKEAVQALKDPKCRAIVLEGPSGSGKTWIADEIANSLPNVTPLFAVGDSVRRAENFAPFEGLTRKRSGLEKMAVDGVRVAAGAGSFFSGFGTLGATVFDWAVSASKSLKSSALAHFSEEEWKWLGKLRRMSKGNPVVLIVDNVHWWDEASFGLVRKLTEALDWSEDTFLESLKIIVVRTVDPSQTDYLAKQFRQWVEFAGTKCFTLEKCSEDQFAAAITIFGAHQKIAQTTLSELYSISAGNLKLAKLISASLIEGSDAEEIATDAASMGLLRALLSERFKSRDKHVEDVLATLKSAALIGVYFYRAEASCLTSKDEDQSDVKGRLESAQATGLIEVEGDRYAFSHPVVLDFVRRELSVEEVKNLSEKLAHCLRLLRPSDYGRQVDLFLAGGNDGEASQAAALHYIQKCRQHENTPEHVPPEHMTLLKNFGLGEFCEAVSLGYQGIGQGSHASALAELEAVGETLLPGLALELTYVRALCRMESGRREDAAAVAKELEAYLEVEETDDFLEVATRIRLLRQQALVLAGKVEDARTNSVALMSFLRKRAAVDRDAATKYHQLLRKSNTIHDPFVAKAHLLQAKTFFQPARSAELPEHPLEYYRTLVNLSGVEIQLGHWTDACEAANIAFELVAANPGFSFPRIDVALNNLNVARTREGLDDVEKSIEQQLIVVNHNQALNDNFQHRSNLAGMHLLAGDLSGADVVLDALETEFSTRSLSELYITFHLRSRRQVLTFLKGDFDGCSIQQQGLKELLKEIDWPSLPALIRRQNMMGELIANHRQLAPTEFDTHFVDLDPTGSGPSWPHFGRGIQFSELQFWSDS